MGESEVITRDVIIEEILKIPESNLEELFKIIREFESATKKSGPGLMSKLRDIKISAAKDLSQTADLYNSGNEISG